MAQVTRAVPAPTPAVTGSGIGPMPSVGLPANVHVAVIGKVVEIEPGVIEVSPYRGAPKERMIQYKVANLKIEDRVLGASGVTRLRVGFPADGLDPGVLGGFATTPRPVATATVGYSPNLGVSLKAGTEGCFLLARHPSADFYVLAAPLKRPTDPGYAKEVDRLKRTALAMNDPVAALKAKNLEERFEAGLLILQQYLTPRGSNAREPVPDEENKLLVALLTELPWLPPGGNRVGKDGRLAPHREALWYKINPAELGFKRPDVPKRNPGDPPVDPAKFMDEASAKFLKENGDKIRLKRFVQK
jgi:hypothetical protein